MMLWPISWSLVQRMVVGGFEVEIKSFVHLASAQQGVRMGSAI